MSGPASSSESSQASEWRGATETAWAEERARYSSLLSSSAACVAERTEGWPQRSLVFALAAAARATQRGEECIHREECIAATASSADGGREAGSSSAPATATAAAAASSPAAAAPSAAAGHLLSPLCSRVSRRSSGWLRAVLLSELLEEGAELQLLLDAVPTMAAELGCCDDGEWMHLVLEGSHPSLSVVRLLSSHARSVLCASRRSVDRDPMQPLMEGQAELDAPAADLLALVQFVHGLQPTTPPTSEAANARPVQLLLDVLSLKRIDIPLLQFACDALRSARAQDASSELQPRALTAAVLGLRLLADSADEQSHLPPLTPQHMSLLLPLLDPEVRKTSSVHALLHALCRRQRALSLDTLRMVAEWDPKAVRESSKRGRTPLLLLLAASASLPAVDFLLSLDPKALDARDDHGHGAILTLAATWSAETRAEKMAALEHIAALRPEMLQQRGGDDEGVLQLLLNSKTGVSLALYERLLALCPALAAEVVAAGPQSTLLHRVCEHSGDAPLIARLLQDAPESASRLCDGCSPLHLYVSNPRCSLATLQLLLAAAPAMSQVCSHHSPLPLQRLLCNVAARNAALVGALVAAHPDALRLPTVVRNVSVPTMQMLAFLFPRRSRELDAQSRSIAQQRAQEDEPILAILQQLLDGAGDEEARQQLLARKEDKELPFALRTYLRRDKCHPAQAEVVRLLMPRAGLLSAPALAGGMPLDETLHRCSSLPSVAVLEVLRQADPAAMLRLVREPNTRKKSVLQSWCALEDASLSLSAEHLRWLLALAPELASIYAEPEDSPLWLLLTGEHVTMALVRVMAAAHPAACAEILRGLSKSSQDRLVYGQIDQAELLTLLLSHAPAELAAELSAPLLHRWLADRLSPLLPLEYLDATLQRDPAALQYRDAATQRVWAHQLSDERAYDREAMRWLLSRDPAALTALAREQETPLHVALARNSVGSQRLLRELLDAEPRAATVANCAGMFPLHLMARHPLRSGPWLERIHALHPPALHAACAQPPGARPLRLAAGCTAAPLSLDVIGFFIRHDAASFNPAAEDTADSALLAYCGTPGVRADVLALLLAQCSDDTVRRKQFESPHDTATQQLLRMVRGSQLTQRDVECFALLIARAPEHLSLSLDGSIRKSCLQRVLAHSRLAATSSTVQFNAIPLLGVIARQVQLAHQLAKQTRTTAAAAATFSSSSASPSEPSPLALLSVSWLAQVWLDVQQYESWRMSAEHCSVFFAPLLVACPALLQWRDAHGSSLLHLAAAGYPDLQRVLRPLLSVCHTLLDHEPHSRALLEADRARKTPHTPAQYLCPRQLQERFETSPEEIQRSLDLALRMMREAAAAWAQVGPAAATPVDVAHSGTSPIAAAAPALFVEPTPAAGLYCANALDSINPWSSEAQCETFVAGALAALPGLLAWRSDGTGQSLLHAAAKAGCLPACRALVAAHASLLAEDLQHYTPLHYCSLVQHPECHAYLAAAQRQSSMFRGRFELSADRAPLLTGGGRLKWAIDCGLAAEPAAALSSCSAGSAAAAPAPTSPAARPLAVLKFFTSSSEFAAESAMHAQLARAARDKHVPRLLAVLEPLAGAEAGSDDSLACIAMECGGESLRAQMQRRLLRTPPQRSWPAMDVLAMARHTVEALRWLHAEDGQATVHADLKPENLVQFADEWRLIDFGSARAIGQPLSEDFTAHFAPPEQARRMLQARVAQRMAAAEAASTSQSPPPPPPPLLADPSYDVWSLGCVLFQLRVGQPLFDSATGIVEEDVDFVLADVASASDDSILETLKFHQKTRALQLHDNEISLLKHMLAVDPAARYSMGDVSAALGLMISGLSATQRERSLDRMVSVVRDVGVGVAKVGTQIKANSRQVAQVDERVEAATQQAKQSEAARADEAAKAARIAELEQQLASARSAQAESSALKLQLASSHSELAASRAELAVLRADVARLSTALSSLRPAGTSAKVAPEPASSPLPPPPQSKSSCVLM